jgi:hypothetical protein
MNSLETLRRAATQAYHMFLPPSGLSLPSGVENPTVGAEGMDFVGNKLRKVHSEGDEESSDILFSDKGTKLTCK